MTWTTQDQEVTPDAADAVQVCQTFVNVLGHDLRGPLNGLTLAARLLQAQHAGSPDLAERLGRILDAAERMDRMVQRLTDFSRIRLGTLPIAPRRADLALVVRGAVQQLERDGGRREVVLELSGDLQGSWDPERVQQALSTLLEGVLGHGLTPIQVRLDGTATERVTLEVRCEHALPPELLGMMREPLRPVGGQRQAAIGLGLYVARQILIAHGGRLEVSVSAERTWFTGWLPRGVAVDTRPCR